MGHNRAGDNVKARKRQRRRESRRLEKLAAAHHDETHESAPAEGLASKAKHLAQDVVGAVGGLIRQVVDRVSGKGTAAPQ